MGTRIQLHSMLTAIREVGNRVYFQPPVSLQIQYPCIVYDLDGENVLNADNLVYNRKRRYTITVIDRNPDSTIPDQVGEMFQIRMDRHFENDHLHHFTYSIIF